MLPKIVKGQVVGQLLGKALERSSDYRRVLVVSAFLDPEFAEVLERLFRQADMCGLKVLVYLGPVGYQAAPPKLRGRCHLVRDLHAKVYALEGLRESDDDLVITSANLTRAGLESNIEVGLRLRGSSEGTRHMIRQVAAMIPEKRDRAKKHRKAYGRTSSPISPHPPVRHAAASATGSPQGATRTINTSYRR